jgi:TolB-like protein
MTFRSPRALGLGAALLLAAAPTAMLRAQNAPAPDRRPTIAVLYFNNGAIGKAADFEALSKGIADLLITDLSANQNIRVVERDRLQALLQEQDLSQTPRIDDATALRLGKVLGAHHIIKGGFVVDPKGRMRLDAHAVNVETTKVDYVETVSGKSDDVLDLISQLSAKLNKGLHLPELSASSGGASSGAGAGSSGAQPAAPSGGGKQVASSNIKGSPFQAVMLYSRALAAEDQGKKEEAVELYKKTLAVFPDNEKAKARLAKLEGSE